MLVQWLEREGVIGPMYYAETLMCEHVKRDMIMQRGVHLRRCFSRAAGQGTEELGHDQG